jgi:two-component system, NarL family, nitrate/nitrite response regulator NarL
MSDSDVRVVIADDHPVYRDGVARAVSERPGLELVGVASDGRAAIAAIRDLRPDVAVLDIKMPELSGIEVVAACVTERLPTRILLLSAYADDAVVYEAIVNGAAGYLMKNMDRDTICAAVESIARGEAVLAPQAQTALTQGLQTRGNHRRPVVSAREREVLRLTAEGLSGPQIGAELHLSPTTVRSHLQSVYEKLGVSDRAAAVATAIRTGLLD